MGANASHWIILLMNACDYWRIGCVYHFYARQSLIFHHRCCPRLGKIYMETMRTGSFTRESLAVGCSSYPRRCTTIRARRCHSINLPITTARRNLIPFADQLRSRSQNKLRLKLNLKLGKGRLRRDPILNSLGPSICWQCYATVSWVGSCPKKYVAGARTARLFTQGRSYSQATS